MAIHQPGWYQREMEWDVPQGCQHTVGLPATPLRLCVEEGCGESRPGRQTQPPKDLKSSSWFLELVSSLWTISMAQLSKRPKSLMSEVSNRGQLLSLDLSRIKWMIELVSFVERKGKLMT